MIKLNIKNIQNDIFYKYIYLILIYNYLFLYINNLL